MARQKQRANRQPTPPALPPETRTVGQVVAEAIRLYGRRVRLSLPLGLPLAAADTLAIGSTTVQRIVVLVIAAPAFTLAFLLREQGDNTIRAAVFVADLVVSPLLFLGGALLYFDQAARVSRTSDRKRSAGVDGTSRA